MSIEQVMKETIKYDENIHPRAAGDYPSKTNKSEVRMTLFVKLTGFTGSEGTISLK